MLERMIKANMVMPLDHAKIPNMANIDKPFQDATFDPGRKHSIPYMWGTLGIGYRKSKVEGGLVDSWKMLLDSDKYAGRISLLGDAQNVIGVGPQVSRLFLQFDRPRRAQEGRGIADRPEEEHQGLRR